MTEEEKLEVGNRLKSDASDLADEFAPKYVFDALKDGKIWVSTFALTGTISSNKANKCLNFCRNKRCSLLHRFFPTNYPQEFGLQFREVAAYDCATLRLWVCCDGHYRIPRR